MSRFQRRQFLIAASALASSWFSMAQSTGAMARIGFLGGGSASAAVKPLEGLRNALRQLGYVEGKSISIEYRWGDGKQEGPMLPKLSHIAVLRNPLDPNNDFQYKDVQDIARSLNIEEQPFDVRDLKDFEGAFTAMAKARVDAVFVLAGALFITHRKQMTDFALKNRLPSVFARSENVEAGGLMSYGSELTDIFAQAARFIDKILRGAPQPFLRDVA